MGKKFSEQHEIKFYECDVTGKLTLPMLLNIVIKTSEAQSESLGRGADYVQAQGFGWVITQHDMEITRLPGTDEVVTVTTQATAYNKYFCYRSFWLHDENGVELVKISSTFVLMDLATRKMTSVAEDIIAPFGCPKITKIQRGVKIEKFSDGLEREYRVRFTDIDMNQHVNNARYFDWMVDCLDFEFLTTHKPCFVSIRFDKELSYGEMITSHWQVSTTEAGGPLSLHRIQSDTTLCAEANITWKKI